VSPNLIPRVKANCFNLSINNSNFSILASIVCACNNPSTEVPSGNVLEKIYLSKFFISDKFSS
jgi:hypothetical protein